MNKQKKEMLPSRELCIKLIRKNNPKNVVKHSLLVNKVAIYLGKKLFENGKKLDLELIDRASILHDIDKVESLKNGNHGIIAEKMLKEKGWHSIAKAVRSHVLDCILEGFGSWEEKVVYYADKRVLDDKIVSLEERLDYIKKRYGHRNEKMLKEFERIRKNAFELEDEIFSKAGVSKGLKEINL